MFKSRVSIAMVINILFFSLMAVFIAKNISIQTISNNEDELSQATNIIYNGPRDKKIIALTFDDGPHPIYTKEILDTLREYNVKATFFILGIHGEFYPELLYRQKEEGHEIGVHSYDHVNMRREEAEIIKEQFNNTQQIIYSVTGENARVFRPPYGTYNQDVYDLTVENECKIVLWTYYQDSKDWSNPGPEKILDTVLTQVKNGDIILLHDHNEADTNHTVIALKEILPELINRGFKFVTVSELLSIK